MYRNFSSPFSELLKKRLKDKTVTIHQRNLRTLAFEMFKVKLSNVISSFSNHCPIVLQTAQHSNVISATTVLYGSETMYFLGTKIWVILPPEMRDVTSPDKVKRKIQE